MKHYCVLMWTSLWQQVHSATVFQRQDIAVIASYTGCNPRSSFACDDISRLYFLPWGLSRELASAYVPRRGARLIYLASFLKYLSAVSCKIYSELKEKPEIALRVTHIYFICFSSIQHFLRRLERQVSLDAVVTGRVFSGLLQQKTMG